MNLVDKIETLGSLVDRGQVDRGDAVRQLMADGGLTEIGAADLLDNWTTARASYEKATQ